MCATFGKSSEPSQNRTLFALDSFLRVFVAEFVAESHALLRIVACQPTKYSTRMPPKKAKQVGLQRWLPRHPCCVLKLQFAGGNKSRCTRAVVITQSTFDIQQGGQAAKPAATGAKNEADILRKQLQAAERRLQEEAILRNEAQVERVWMVMWDSGACVVPHT